MAAVSFRRNALRLAQGTALSQALIVIATPLLTRLYTPADFGSLAVFTSLYAILGNASALKFEQAIFLPKGERLARDLTRLVLLSAFAYALVTLVAIIAVFAMHLAEVHWYLFFLPPTLVTGALFSVGQIWSSRQKTFGFYAKSTILNSVVNIGACLLLYRFSWGGTALVIGYSLGISCAAFYLLYRKRWMVIRLFHERGRRFMHLFFEYKEFPFYVLPNVILMTLSYQVMPLLIAHYFNVESTGFFSVANRMLVLPSILVGSAVSEAFRSEFVSRIHANSDYRRFFDGVLARLVLFGIAAYALAWLVSPFLFRLVLGERFAPAGYFARYLCLGMAGLFLSQPFSYVFVALGKSRNGLVLQIVSTLMPIAGFLWGAYIHDITQSLLLSSFGAFIGAMVTIGFAFAYVHKRQGGATLHPS